MLKNNVEGDVTQAKLAEDIGTSAPYANRVNNRIVGLVTGAVLTVLGRAMLILNYRDAILRFIS